MKQLNMLDVPSEKIGSIEGDGADAADALECDAIGVASAVFKFKRTLKRRRGIRIGYFVEHFCRTQCRKAEKSKWRVALFIVMITEIR